MTTFLSTIITSETLTKAERFFAKITGDQASISFYQLRPSRLRRG